jgi:hypothetical protein
MMIVWKDGGGPEIACGAHLIFFESSRNEQPDSHILAKQAVRLELSAVSTAGEKHPFG